MPKEDWYVKFEKAFVPADLWTCVCAVLGAIGLLTGQTYGLLFALLAAGSFIFLASMDITFNVQNKLYSLITTSSQMKFELFINLWILALGIIFIISLWSRIALI